MRDYQLLRMQINVFRNDNAIYLRIRNLNICERLRQIAEISRFPLLRA